MAGVASLLEAERARLAQSLGTASFTIGEASEDHCRVVIDGLTIHFYRRRHDGLIHSSLELASVPSHAVPLTDHLNTWLLLKSHGEEWPETKCPDPLLAELARLARALQVLRDEAMLVESLLWDAGYKDGFAVHARPWD